MYNISIEIFHWYEIHYQFISNGYSSLTSVFLKKKTCSDFFEKNMFFFFLNMLKKKKKKKKKKNTVEKKNKGQNVFFSKPPVFKVNIHNLLIILLVCYISSK